MTIRFRTPFWYKFALLALWVVSFDLTIFLLYKPLLALLKYLFLILDIIFGVWVLSIFKREIVVDQEADALRLGKKVFRLSSVKSVEKRALSVVFYFEDGTSFVFPHPVEDFDFLKKLIVEKGSE
ncbi:MAG: hypothetical protein PWQ26_495 [Thermotoga sp.]|jgi:hypothetical protein|nr:hypothetical protein [Thermotoga sp.]